MKLTRNVLLALAGLLLSAPLFAQNARPRQNAAPAQPRAQAPRPANAAQPTPLPPIQKLNELDPVLHKALHDWHASSKLIKKLHGEQMRFVYNYTFSVETQSRGKFYYESPDRGRIDFLPHNPPPNTKHKKQHPDTRKIYVFKAKAETTSQRWICDGNQILAIDDDNKTAQQHPLPAAAKGEHIMDGPLPFLFGMPPDKAVQRYYLRLDSNPAGKARYTITVRPRWRQDAANYKWARIQIEKSTMLPTAVQLMSPSGTTETVFTFPKVARNPRLPNLVKTLFGVGDPFRPNLRNYKIQRLTAQQPSTGKKLVPSVQGMDFREAEKVLKLSGYRVTFHRGEPAINKQLVFRVAAQSPLPKTELAKDGLVRLTLFTEPIAQTGGEASGAKPKSANRTASGQTPAPTQKSNSRQIRTPNLSGLHWKDADKHLKAAGIEVRFLRGKLATSKKDYFRVYAQSPKPETAMDASQPITLTLFVTPEIDAARRKPQGPR